MNEWTYHKSDSSHKWYLTFLGSITERQTRNYSKFHLGQLEFTCGLRVGLQKKALLSFLSHTVTFLSLFLPRVKRQNIWVWKSVIAEHSYQSFLGSAGMEWTKKPQKLQQVHFKTYLLEISLICGFFSWWLLRHLLLFPYKLFQKMTERWLKRFFRLYGKKESIDYFCPCFDHSFHDSQSAS